MRGLGSRRGWRPARVRVAVGIGAAVTMLASVAGWAVQAQPATAVTPTIVTLGFDDGTADHFTQAYPLLVAHGMKATFFVNTGFIGTNGHMTWSDLTTMYDGGAGMEIAGHTIDHANIQPLSVADAENEVCTDRNTLITQGFAPESFAYPFGSWDTTSEAVVRYCGYDSARTVSGVSKKRAAGETVPPADPYATRTPANPKKSTKLSTLEGYVTRAETDTSQTTDWVQFVFHRVCDKSTGGHCGAYTISPTKLDAFLTWLQTQVSQDKVIVQTTAQVINGPLHPACDVSTGTDCQGQAP